MSEFPRKYHSLGWEVWDGLRKLAQPSYQPFNRHLEVWFRRPSRLNTRGKLATIQKVGVYDACMRSKNSSSKQSRKINIRPKFARPTNRVDPRKLLMYVAAGQQKRSRSHRNLPFMCTLAAPSISPSPIMRDER